MRHQKGVGEEWINSVPDGSLWTICEEWVSPVETTFVMSVLGVERLQHVLECVSWGPSKFTHIERVCEQRQPLVVQFELRQVWGPVRCGAEHYQQQN